MEAREDQKLNKFLLKGALGNEEYAGNKHEQLTDDINGFYIIHRSQHRLLKNSNLKRRNPIKNAESIKRAMN